MAGAHSVTIVISAHNRASKPIRAVHKDLNRFRTEVVRFNRNLFTASAIIATFAAGFRRAFNLTGVGAQFEFVRQQFLQTFGEGYLMTLKKASRYTMDAMTTMQLAVKNHARGLKKWETEKIFTLSVGAAKILGTSTANAAKQMSAAFTNLSVKGLQTFLVALNTNNQFSNMNVLIQKLTKGLNAAGRMTENFRRVALAELSKTLMRFVDTGDNALQVIMMTKASFQDLKSVIGSFLGRAIAPLAKQMAMLNFSIFAKLLPILDGTDSKMRSLRSGIVALTQSIGGLVATIGGVVGGWSLLRLLSATLGFRLSTFAGIVGLLAGAFMSAKDSSKGWMETLADIGAEMKFYFQAFMTYKDGVSTFSRDVATRIGGMSQESQERILMIAKALVQAKEIMLGFFQGLKAVMTWVGKAATTVVDWTLKVAKFFGLIDAKQFSAGRGKLLRGVGMVAGGALGVGLLGNLVAKAFGRNLNVFKGGLFGKRGSSPTRPLFVIDVGGKGAGVAGGLLGKIPGAGGSVLKGLGIVGVLGALGVAVYKLTSWLDKKWGMSTAIGEGLAKITHRPQLEGHVGAKKLENILSGKATVSGKRLDISQLTEQTRKSLELRSQQMSKGLGSIDMNLLYKIMEDGVITQKEANRLLDSIDHKIRLDAFEAANTKPTAANFLGK